MHDSTSRIGEAALSKLRLIGVLTWVIVGIPSLHWEIANGTVGSPRALAWLACFCLFIISFWMAPRGLPARRMAVIAIETLFAVGACYFQQAGFQPILLVIIAGQLGAIGSSFGVWWIGLQTLALGAISYRQSSFVVLVMAYLAFQLFAMLTGRVAHNEAEARQALARAHAELRVTTGLLEMNSRTEERLRISRDLHDLLGHHLAALSINLEVARHLSTGEARSQIEKSQAVAKLLLSDVRDVVSRLREDDPVDLAAAVQTLTNVVSRPELHLDLSRDLAISDHVVAQAAWRAIQEIVTNAVRHSGARNLWLSVKAADGALQIDARDDGSGADHVQFGNGLRGMRERVSQVNGTMEVASARAAGFEVHVRLPLTGPA